MLPFKDLCYVKRHNYYLVIPMLIMLIFSVALVINRPLFGISAVLTEDKRFILVIIFCVVVNGIRQHVDYQT